MKLVNHNYLSEYSVEANETTIANLLKEFNPSLAQHFCNYNCSLVNSPISLVNVLKKWGILSELKLFDFSSMSSSSTPFILDMKSSFAIVKKGLNEEIEIIDPIKGIEYCKLEDLKPYNKRFACIPVKVENINESEIELKKVKYHQKKDNFISQFKFVPNFLEHNSCDKLISYSIPRLLPSKIETNTGIQTISVDRTSYSAEISITQSEIKYIIDQAKDILEKPEQLFEKLQCVSYKSGQFFKAHFDQEKRNSNGYIRNLSCVIYLNDNFKGGGTNFPRINKTVVPQKGSAVFFPLVDKNYNPCYFSLHEGQAILSGQKFALNLWGITKTSV
tara:strand:- start:110 stop:1105 length:996 start_codon:yes stop_codon:yes gene_type:complete